MAIGAAMNNNNQEDSNKQDDHENDTVMPGFRFHPTEEELVEFYLRRKVEGKRFNVELITLLDLYRYDPWELPAFAAIGEKEWYFYVPRDRKYRNGDRPNRVTTSGYWKATGADRMIRSENLRSIGLKKTLVFYSGKAPKGIRTSWIMNEYRLPQHETERLQKAEISLCRVYKRAGGVEDRSSPTTKASSSRSARNETVNVVATSSKDMIFQTNYGWQMQQITDRKVVISETLSQSSSNDIGTSLGLSHRNSNDTLVPKNTIFPKLAACNNNTISSDHSLSGRNCPSRSNIFPSSSSNVNALDELHKLVVMNNYSQQAATVIHENQHHHHHHQYDLLSHFSGLPPPATTLLSERLMWDWNAVSEVNKDYTNLFK